MIATHHCSPYQLSPARSPSIYFQLTQQGINDITYEYSKSTLFGDTDRLQKNIHIVDRSQQCLDIGYLQDNLIELGKLSQERIALNLKNQYSKQQNLKTDQFFQEFDCKYTVKFDDEPDDEQQTKLIKQEINILVNKKYQQNSSFSKLQVVSMGQINKIQQRSIKNNIFYQENQQKITKSYVQQPQIIRKQQKLSSQIIKKTIFKNGNFRTKEFKFNQNIKEKSNPQKSQIIKSENFIAYSQINQPIPIHTYPPSIRSTKNVFAKSLGSCKSRTWKSMKPSPSLLTARFSQKCKTKKTNIFKNFIANQNPQTTDRNIEKQKYKRYNRKDKNHQIPIQTDLVNFQKIPLNNNINKKTVINIFKVNKQNIFKENLYAGKYHNKLKL